MASGDFQIGDILTIDNNPQIPKDMRWRVDAIVPGKGVRLRPAGDSSRDRFNDAASELWIAGPDDRPFN